MAFRGNFPYQMDDRNRVALPPRYRDQFAAGAVLVPGVDPFIEVWTVDGYDAQEKVLDEVDFESDEGRKFRRALDGYAFDVQLDSQHRVLIPPLLVGHAQLSKEVVVVGTRECLEIWDKARWEAQFETLRATRQEVLAEIGARKKAARLAQAG